MENIGIVISENKGGGMFQYALAIADSLIKYSNKYNYIIFAYSHDSLNRLEYPIYSNIDHIFIPKKKYSVKNKIKLACNLAIRNNFFNVQNNEIISQIKNHQVKLLITPNASLFCINNNIPYITCIPDIMYRYYPSFPEFPLKARIIRNIVYENASKHSLFAVVDSKQGADDLNIFYKIPKEKIKIITMVPAGYIYKYKDMSIETASNTLVKYSIPNKFLFYPAQFWYHKNHIRLFKAIKFINEFYQEKIYLVLVGSPKESYKKIMNFIKKSDISNQIIYLGYVSDEEIVALYKKAIALVYPSLFGPTNIPPLEAMLLGTPVLCSDLFSMPDQIGDAGLLFDPFEIKDIADKIYKIWMDKDLRSDLIRKGYKKTKDMTLERYAKQWEDVIEEALEKIT